MRKVYAIILFALLTSGSSFAQQRTVDWQVVSVLKPSELNSNTQTGTAFDIEAVFKNNGPDTVKAGDSILYQVVLTNMSNQVIFALPSTTSYNIGTNMRRVNPGDTMHFHLRFNFSQYVINSTNVKVNVVSIIFNRAANGVKSEVSPGTTNNVLAKEMVWWNPQKFGVGIAEVSAENLMNVYPNPASNVLHIDYKMASIKSPNTITIFDIQGKVVAELISEAGAFGETMDISGLQPGIYLVRVSNDEMEANQKIQITR